MVGPMVKAFGLVLAALWLSACQRGCAPSGSAPSEDDARVSLVGPKPGEFRPIAPKDAMFEAFEAGGSRVVYAIHGDDGTRFMSVAIEGEPHELELAHVEHYGSSIDCALSDDPCLIDVTERSHPTVLSTKDPSYVVLVRRAQKQSLKLVGPWGKDAGSGHMSPDGTFAVIGGIQAKPEGGGFFRVLHFVLVEAPDKIVTYVHGDDWPDIDSWQGAGDDLRAIVRNARYGEAGTSWASFDPRTNQTTELPEQPSRVSPDGKHRCSCKKGEEIVITDVASGATRSFPLMPRERHLLRYGCDVAWRGSQFLEFWPERSAFIDIESLKLSYPFAAGAEPLDLHFDRSLTWAVITQNSQPAIARVTVR